MLKLFKKDLCRRCYALIICAVILALTPLVSGAAPDISGQASAETQKPAIYINSQRYGGKAFIENSTTYVGIREFSMFMGADSIDWNSEEKTAVIFKDSLKISAKYRDTYIIANGRYIWAKDGIKIIEGTMYVPLRVIAKAFGCTVGWSAPDFSAFVEGGGIIADGDSYYDSGCVLWLARIINAEAGGEPLLGKIAVGTVVLNRVDSSLFPSTIYGVIFDRSCGIQFTPAANGTVYNTPNEESIIAAKLCLDGARVSDSVLFFVNERLAENTWVSDNRPYEMTIGNHTFFS